MGIVSPVRFGKDFDLGFRVGYEMELVLVIGNVIVRYVVVVAMFVFDNEIFASTSTRHHRSLQSNTKCTSLALK
jgi:hypothetical protein